MQGQFTEFAENMRHKDLMIEDLKQKLRDQIAYMQVNWRPCLTWISTMRGWAWRTPRWRWRTRSSSREGRWATTSMNALTKEWLLINFDVTRTWSWTTGPVSRQWWRTSRKRTLNYLKSTINFAYCVSLRSCRAGEMMWPTRPIHWLSKNFEKNSADYNKNCAWRMAGSSNRGQQWTKERLKR